MGLALDHTHRLQLHQGADQVTLGIDHILDALDLMGIRCSCSFLTHFIFFSCLAVVVPAIGGEELPPEDRNRPNRPRDTERCLSLPSIAVAGVRVVDHRLCHCCCKPLTPPAHSPGRMARQRYPHAAGRLCRTCRHTPVRAGCPTDFPEEIREVSHRGRHAGGVFVGCRPSIGFGERPSQGHAKGLTPLGVGTGFEPVAPVVIAQCSTH